MTHPKRDKFTMKGRRRMTIIPKVPKLARSFLKCRWVFVVTVLMLLGFIGIPGFLLNCKTALLRLDESLRICQPRTNIAFLKTHKCAGSSVQNIIMRFGDRHNLTFVLPLRGNYIGHPVPFSSQLLPTFSPPPVYNILAHHTRLDYNEIMSVMSKDTVFVTIVRDPVQLFESAYIYYGLDRLFNGSLHEFIDMTSNHSMEFLNRRRFRKIGINQMMFDLGADPTIFHNDSLVTQYINQLESWFHLVLVAERMDESLILLKHLMCWDMEDVVVFKVNARKPMYKSNLSENEISKLRTLNRADQLLYNNFVTKLDNLIQNFGTERMESEVSLLRQRTRDWYEFCVTQNEPSVGFTMKPKYNRDHKILVFERRPNISNGTCLSLTSEELPYTDYLRQKQNILYSVALSTSKQSETKLGTAAYISSPCEEQNIS